MADMKAKILLVSLLFTMLLCSCNKFEKKILLRNQKMVHQAEAFINTREFDKAKESVDLALKDLNSEIQKHPENPHLRIIRAQALLTLFRAENFPIFDQSPPRPRNLIQLPKKHEFMDLEKTLPPAIEDLKFALQENLRSELTTNHEIIAYTTLGHIYRLDETQLEKADKAYETVSEILKKEYKSQWDKLSSSRPHRRKLDQLQNQLNYVIFSQVEVNLLAENWPKALGLLEQLGGKQDLKFFSTQFPLMENKIENIKNKIAELKASPNETRDKKLVNLIQAKRSNKPMASDAIGIYEGMLVQAEIDLANLTNNLKYRIICYNNIKDKNLEKEARRILRMYFPQLDVQFDQFKQFN